VDDEGEHPVKLYYRIGEVSDLVGVEPHVLRYWESEFRSIRPQKSRKGQRIYSRRDVDRLLKVKDLLYTHGFTIAGARRRLRETGAEPPTTAEVAASERSLAALRDLRRDVESMLAEVELLAAPATGRASM
jgi:DNA-binding transcriptional MerR regulator